ncbi:MAG: PKD domain-containing protein [Chitinophagales bacterium]|nr:PKD domain-containing protein [Chitinophagales bacterium]
MNAFLAPGGFRYSLQNSQGCQGTTTAPTASFTASPTNVCPGGTVQFTSTSTGNITSYSWTFNGGTPATSTAANPTVTYNTPGTYSVSLTVTGPGGSNTATQTNYITVSGASNLPLTEGFESSTFPPPNWTIINGDGATTWVRTTSASGFGASTACAYVNCYNYANATNQRDWLITPSYNFSGVTLGRIKWDYAYAAYNSQATYADSLAVYYSTNCGATWNLLWIKGGTALATANNTTNQFVPSASQWKRDSVSLSNLAGQSNVRFAFVTTNKYGNNIFLDNVNIYAVNTGAIPPVVDFVGTPTTVVAGNSVAFTDLSTNSPTSWSWQFPGAATPTSTQQNPTVTYNTPGVYNVTLTAGNSGGSNTVTKNNYITVIASGGATTCDTLTNLTASDTLVAYMYNPAGGATGYVTGHNSYQDKAYAQYYPNTTTKQVTGAFIAFARAKTNNPTTANVAVKVWNANGNNNSPGTVLGTQNVLINSLTAQANSGQVSYIPFSSPPTVTGNFYIGVELTYAAGDTVAVYSTTFYSPNPDRGWYQESNNLWFPFDSIIGPGFGIDLFILPVLCSNTGAPVANFTATPTSVCVGKSVTFTSTSTGNPTSYSWQFQGGTPAVSTAANPTVTYNTPGTYNVTLTVSNANGSNTKTQTAYITVNALPDVTLSVTPVACFGQSTGSVTATATGSSPFTYAWSGGGSGPTLTNKPAGAYSVTVTDSKQCSVSATTNIPQPLTALNVSASGINASCGLQNGSVTATATGGAGGYAYTWSNGANGETLSNLGAGTYQVTVTDANACTASGSVTITASTVTFVVNLNVTNATCGQNNGSIAVIGFGNQSGVTYQWSNGASGSFIGSLSPGTYSVTVTKPDGCTASSTANVLDGGSPIQLTPNSTHATCGSSNGSATVNVSYGQPPYNYAWNTGATTPVIANLAAGSYQVTVTDANNCTASVIVAVSNQNAPVVNVQVTPVSCFGQSDGSATASVTSGSSPFTYTWSQGSTSPSVNNLSAGNYVLTVTDASGCKSIQVVTIHQPAPIVLSPAVTATTCGAANGSIVILAQGGNGNYQFTWSNGSTGETIANLAAGNYSVTATDSKGCTASQSFTVGSSSPPSVSITVQSPGTPVSNDGSITAVASGGTPPYTYNWSNGQTGPVVTNIGQGIYYLTVNDAAGCVTVQEVSVYVSGLGDVNEFSSIKIYPNPFTQELYLTGLPAGELCTVRVYDATGRMVLETTSQYNTKLITDTWCGGVYVIRVTGSRQSITYRAVKP